MAIIQRSTDPSVISLIEGCVHINVDMVAEGSHDFSGHILLKVSSDALQGFSRLFGQIDSPRLNVHGQETNLVAGEPPEQLARGKQNPPSEFLSFAPLQGVRCGRFHPVSHTAQKRALQRWERELLGQVQTEQGRTSLQALCRLCCTLSVYLLTSAIPRCQTGMTWVSPYACRWQPQWGRKSRQSRTTT